MTVSDVTWLPARLYLSPAVFLQARGSGERLVEVNPHRLALLAKITRDQIVNHPPHPIIQLTIEILSSHQRHVVDSEHSRTGEHVEENIAGEYSEGGKLVSYSGVFLKDFVYPSSVGEIDFVGVYVVST